MKPIIKITLWLILSLLAACGGDSQDKREPTPEPTPTTPTPDQPTSPLSVPAYWGFYGDSHTAGRAEITSASSPSKVFRAIWDASGFTAPTQVQTRGVGGRSLQGTYEAWSKDSYASTPWIHTQESGDQSDAGQQTPVEFGNTFEAYWRAVDAKYPSALKTYETAHSFLLLGTQWRDWQSTQNWQRWGYASQAEAISYNAEMLRRIQILKDDGIVVHPVYTAEYIDALIARIPGGYPTIEVDGNPRHYNAIGNFMIALAMFKALGYDISSLNVSGITVDNDSALNTQYKTLCLEVAKQPLPH